MTGLGLKQGREKRDLTQQELAAASGIPQPDICDMEAGRLRISAQNERRIREAFRSLVRLRRLSRFVGRNVAEEVRKLAAR